MSQKLKFPLLAFSLLLFCVHVIAQVPNAALFQKGAGSFEYTAYAPLKDKPITVFYYVPTSGDIAKMKVLFSMHGAERNGAIQRGVWRNIAEEYGFIVIAPQYAHANKYLENDYQFGGVSHHPKNFSPREEEQWTYKTVEAIFDFFKKSTGNKAKTYDMFGHSAGGQFVHRYLLMTPEARVGKAVAANPGNYTYPQSLGLSSSDGTFADPSGWPFSLQGTKFETPERLAAFFKRKLTIAIGANDTVRVDTEKTKATDPSYIQGINRYERAFKYFEFCKSLAKSKGMQFNWNILEVPEAGHSSAQIIYGTTKARNQKLENDERVYNIEDITDLGAFKVLVDKR